MASVNKWIGIGNLGRDPEVRYTASGDAICNFSIACTDTWKDKQTGEKKEQTEWVRISFFGKLAEVCGQYLKKGSQAISKEACAHASGLTRTARRNTPRKSVAMK